MPPRIGIDLGTTFSCVAFLAEGGAAQVMRDSRDDTEIPSVISFDGNNVYVGRAAVERKPLYPNSIVELFKPDMGRPLTGPGGVGDRYSRFGFNYGPAGMSAIVLRYLKKQAVRHLRQVGLLQEMDDRKAAIEAVITVPASFGELQRQETRCAGLAAGLDVVGIINEPTAAALAYSLHRDEDQRILVFDLGGGTFDVTLLRMESGEPTVEATRGDNHLGGSDFDELIAAFVQHVAERERGGEDLEGKGFEIQRLARHAKHQLSERDAIELMLTLGESDVCIPLRRKRPEGDDDDVVPAGGGSPEFFFEERSRGLLTRCRVICEMLFEEAPPIRTNAGERRLEWRDIDEIVLAGGSCRMPMVPEMLERLANRRIRRHFEGFSYDTAIAVGAAYYGAHRDRVQDVLSHDIGIKVQGPDGRLTIDKVFGANAQIPATAARMYRVEGASVLELLEGESFEPDECEALGSLDLNTDPGRVSVELEVTGDGLLRAKANGQTLEIRREGPEFSDRCLGKLRERVAGLVIHA